jgi:hypothetical protein
MTKLGSRIHASSENGVCKHPRQKHISQLQQQEKFENSRAYILPSYCHIQKSRLSQKQHGKPHFLFPRGFWSRLGFAQLGPSQEGDAIETYMKLVFIPMSDFVAFSDPLIEKQSSPKSVSAQSVGEAEEGNSGESRLRILHQ